ncbi:MAG: SoxR reducing system RseC family protein [Methylococcales bacterium]
MVEEQAIVIAVRADNVWVKTTTLKTCATCPGCSSSLLAHLFSGNNKSLLVDTLIQLDVGETVIVGIDERKLLNWAVVIYLLPLIGFFSGAIIGRFVADSITFFGENLIVLAGGIVCFALVVKYVRKSLVLKSHQLRPVVLRKA